MSIAFLNFLLFGGLQFDYCREEYKKEISLFSRIYDNRIATAGCEIVLDSDSSE